MDTNQAGATMASRYTVAKNAAIIGASVISGGALARGGSMVTGSRAYKVYGAVKETDFNFRSTQENIWCYDCQCLYLKHIVKV